MKEKTLKLIEPYYKYINEVIFLKSALDSIRVLVEDGIYELNDNVVSGKRITQNGNNISLYLKCNNELVDYKVEGEIQKVHRRFIRLDNHIWKLGEINIKKKEDVVNIYNTAYLFKKGIELSRLINHRRVKPSKDGRTLNIYDDKSSYYFVGNNLYKIVERDGEKKTYEYKNYTKDLIGENLVFNNSFIPFEFEDYYLGERK